MKSTNRRDFIKKTALTGSVLPFLSFPLSAWAIDNDTEQPLSVNIFSKHLQFLDYKTTGDEGLKPMTIKEFNTRIDQSMEDSRNNRLIEASELKAKIDKWN